MTPSLDDIALFVEVGQTLSFSRAAALLAMPASTLSRRIALLEQRIGVRLLHRNTRKVELTEAGAEYFARCRHIIEEARIAHEQLIGSTHDLKGLLRVSMPTSFAMTFMPLAILAFHQRYPDIACEYDMSIKPVDFLSDHVDIVLRHGKQPSSGIVSHPLVTVSLGLYASPDYLRRHGQPAAPAELASHICLRASTSREDTVWRLHNHEGTQAAVEVDGPIAINHVVMLTRMAVLGVGIVPLSTHPLLRMDEGRDLVRLLPEWTFEPLPLLALFPSRLMPAKSRVFIDFLTETLAHPERLGTLISPG
ncbi:LysR family transcriptional regulator [Pusillimonas sp. TS35]|uniref:LysR family transcriptional regulator n=1 Tax=Paracandidimonas lactea TaxID=2895524 RepID=UPI0013719451|nr:LysR family transcriptional regulator [Paracandidimonas lactea]MYN13040.1 LysR family transcriptional regulator [Pusillimonas sp. TS35]